MNWSSQFIPADPAKPHFPREDQSAKEARERLMRARDLALSAVATLPISVTRTLNQCMADVANEIAFADAPLTALQDALQLCRNLMRDQAIAGQLDGTYPTERYR